MRRVPHFPKGPDAPWAVVTGASGGIGLEFSRELGKMGCNLIMVSNRPGDLERCRKEIREGCGVEAHALDIDLTEADADKRIMDFIAEKKVVPELLVNNAGIFDFRAVESMSARRIDMYIDLHMRAVTRLTVALGRLMADNGGGRILNMSSMSCWMPMPGIALYSATKAYIRAFSRAYRVEMLDRGVSVTVACPGGIATDLFGLPRRLQRLGVRLGILDRPASFARRALKRTVAGKAQYINGFVNRISIVSVASLPEWGRKIIKRHLLDKIGGK